MTTSVAICTYNGEKYIAEQLNSIVNQSVKPDQIVLSDDNSSDNTVQIAEELLKNSGISYLININKPNIGITKNFDKALSLCTGDILFPCDQDNVWMENFIEEFLACFKKDSNLVYVTCNGIVTDENLTPIADVPHLNETFLQLSNIDKKKFLDDSLSNIFFPCGHTIAFKRFFFNEIIPSGFFYDEWTAICAAATGRIAGIDKKLILFRRHKEAATGTSGGGNKWSISKTLFDTDFEEHFAWSGLRAEAYDRYLKMYKDILPEKHISFLNDRIEFCNYLAYIKNKNLFTREYYLIKAFNTVGYRKWRGTRNTFILDFLYLLFNKK